MLLRGVFYITFYSGVSTQTNFGELFEPNPNQSLDLSA